MSMRIAVAPLLALVGHELRAPAGVVGGYLALLERGPHALTPEQQKALAGARRAQQSLVEALDDLRRLTVAWQVEHESLASAPLARLADEVRAGAAARGLSLTLDIAAAAATIVPQRGHDAALADGLVTVVEAVGREHGAGVVATATLEGPVLVWRVRPAGAPAETDGRRHDFDLWRPGLGVRLVAAAVAITAAHGTLHDVRVGTERVGVDVTFDLTALAPPPATDAV